MTRDSVPNDKEREVQHEQHLTRPPRLEGAVKNAGMKSHKKPKGFKPKSGVSKTVKKQKKK